MHQDQIRKIERLTPFATRAIDGLFFWIRTLRPQSQSPSRNRTGSCPSATPTLPETLWRRLPTTRFSWKLAGLVIVIGVLAALMWFSLYLGAMRIYQVDEGCNIYAAKLMQEGRIPGGDLFQILLSFLVPPVQQAVSLFTSGRLIMVVMFWLNWILLASATGARLFSGRWWIALLGAATLAPLWDYGFEIRHDNLLLAGILLMWCAVRCQPAKESAYCFVGICTVVLEFVASKAFVYTIPISAAALLFPFQGTKAVPRRRLFLAWLLGAVAGWAIQHFISKSVGLGNVETTLLVSVAGVPAKAMRFWPWKTCLGRLLVQTPLLLAVSLAALMALTYDLLRTRQFGKIMDGYLPEAFLFVVALAALVINPNPYPYNLLHLVPYAYLLAFRYGSKLWGTLKNIPAVFPVLATVVIFAHLVPFGLATQRHLSLSNTRQETLIGLAERSTDPKKDPVFDGTGMVPTRSVVNPLAFIHGQSLGGLLKGGGPQIRDMLKENPAAVIIPSYRTDWLPQQDHDYIAEHYVSLADDFLVLGKVMPAGGGQFEVIHPGRYRISTIEASDLAGTYSGGLDAIRIPEQDGKVDGLLDGIALTGQVVELTVGTHSLTSYGSQAAVVWVGPRQNRLHRLPQSDHRRVFVNWY